MNSSDQSNGNLQQNAEEFSAGKEPFIVGIGASAGGIQALQQFFRNVNAESGMVYVVILHLSPDHDSKLAEVLRHAATIPVTQVLEKIKVQPNHVYVIPPDKHLMMSDGHIVVSQNVEEEDRRAPVDIFFRTLAISHGPQAICVVLSGTGANGSMGLKRIKEMGGAAFVQNPREAEYNEMPRNSIATDLVDAVLPVSEIPEKIFAYTKSVGTIQIPLEPENRVEEQQQALREIFTHLRLRTGHDFSNYKRPTLLRRIERRITIRNLPDLPSYAKYVQQNPEEVTALLKDLLISVTNFFRDKKAFEIVESKILPEILQTKKAEDQLRVWVAGCATGEEAYSFAMICAEKTLNVIDAPRIQIFATDIDEAAISFAREALYTINDAADVSPERLRLFFNKEKDGYRVRREIREMILFANHNFIKDPPFSRLDMVSCRNVLIYLNHAAQERVLETFHFALNRSGYLFLGSAESADSASDLYSVYNREEHIFRARQVTTRVYPVPETVPNFNSQLSTLNITSNQAQRTKERMTVSDLHQRLLEEYAPPSIVVNEEYDIVHLSERAGRYLQITGGEPSQNLLKLVRPELRLELRSALYKAMQHRAPVEARGLKVNTGSKSEIINIQIRPVLRGADIADGYMLILFGPSDENSTNEVVIAADEPVARQLEEELIRLKVQLRDSVEQHEFQAEELKASNEELQAMNEELRSAAEELETSKEELQSINEELRTVNQELNIKVEETTLAGNNLQNLINSVDLGTIFLNRSFRVAFFTPAARNLFNLIPNDIGRPLSDITNKFEGTDILSDAGLVLQKLHKIEREIYSNDGRIFLMRVLPYRTEEDRINGVVITFFDITDLKRSEQALRESKAQIAKELADMQQLQNISGQLILEDNINALYSQILDAAMKIMHTDTGSIQIFHPDKQQLQLLVFKGFDAHSAAKWEWLPADLDTLYGGILARGERLDIKNITENRHIGEKEIESYTRSGILSLQSTPLIARDGKFLGIISTHWHSEHELNEGEARLLDVLARQAADLIERRQGEVRLRISEERYRIALKSANMGAWDWNIAGNTIISNEQMDLLLGLPVTSDRKDVFYLLEFIHPDDSERVASVIQKAVDTKTILHVEFRIIRADTREVRWMSGYGRTVDEKDNKATRMVGVMYDITTHKTLEQQKDDFISIASHELKTPITSIKIYSEILHERSEKNVHAEDHGLIKKLNGQVDRLTDLISDLLDTSKISEGKLPLNSEQFNLKELIQKHIEELQHTTDDHKIVLNSSEVIPVVADKERIGQVISNLISNAIKYSPQGGEITVSAESLDHTVKVSVRDRGIGIAEELRDKVFDRFFRINSPEMRTYPGMGLGLYISAGIIHRHGGIIDVESKAGEGTVFYFVLPLKDSKSLAE